MLQRLCSPLQVWNERRHSLAGLFCSSAHVPSEAILDFRSFACACHRRLQHAEAFATVKQSPEMFPPFATSLRRVSKESFWGGLRVRTMAGRC